MKTINVLLFLGLFIVLSFPAHAQDEHWICHASALTSFSEGARQSEWGTEAQTWRVLNTGDPSIAEDDYYQYWTGSLDVLTSDLGIQYASADFSENGPAYVDFYDVDTGLLWKFAYKDLIPTTENGRYGHHHSCEQGPIVYTLTGRD